MWLTLLEFRFRVHEYLKGSGPIEIGSVVYLVFADGWDWDGEATARRLANGIGDTHDSRWDNRAAIVFLSSAIRDTPDIAPVRLASDRYWFGRMIDDRYGDMADSYTVASRYKKLWLPEATTITASRSSTGQGDKLFLLDAPSATTTSGGASLRSTTVTAPTISVQTLKNSITTVEAEANAGGTAEYRECGTSARRFLRITEYEIARRGKPTSHADLELASGLPAGEVIFEIEREDVNPERPGRGWTDGPDKDIVRYAT